MSLEQATMSVLNLLDAKLDDLADLPEWKTFPDGVYRVKPSVKTEKKPNKNNPKQLDTIITIGAKLMEVKDLANPNEVKPEVGAETSARYTWENQFGQGGIKNLIKPIAEVMAKSGNPVTSVVKLLEILGSADSVLLVMSHRDVTNGSKTQSYQSFDELIVD